MQYLGKVLELTWPDLLLAALWLVGGVLALFYARSTRRPIFLFGGLAGLLLMVDELLSPGRAAYRYFTHKYLCTTTAQCKSALLFGAYKYQWVVEGLAALLLLTAVILEVARARRRAARNNAAYAAAHPPVGAPVAAGAAPAAPFAGPYHTQPTMQPLTSYGAPPDAFAAEAPDGFGDPADPADPSARPRDERPTLYQRPASGSGSLT